MKKKKKKKKGERKTKEKKKDMHVLYIHIITGSNLMEHQDWEKKKEDIDKINNQEKKIGLICEKETPYS